MRTTYLRHPKGNVNAARNNARVIPPTSWEDKCNKKLNSIWKYAERLLGYKGWNKSVANRLNFGDFYKKVNKKFPTLNKEEIRAVYYLVIEVRN